MSGSVDVEFLLLLVVVLLAVVAFAVVRWHAAVVAATAARADAEVWARAVAVRDAELTHLVEQRLPAQTDGGWRTGGRVPGLLHEELAGSAVADAHAAVLAAVAARDERAEDAARGVLLSVARTLGGLANDVQTRINRMQAAHDAPDVLADVMEVDHGVAQMLRRTEAMTVLCRAWAGRQHDATPLVDVVRGAAARITAYKRIQIVRVDDPRAVVGRLVGPVVMAIAELLDNATRFSDPNTSVPVHVQLTTEGAAVVIEDAGVGLNQADLAKATRLLTEPDLPIAALGSPPHFGLAACGALARRYGIRVSVDNSSVFGGARAVVGLPGTLLTDPPQIAGLVSRPAQPDITPAPANGARGLVAGLTAQGLPKRRRPHPAETLGSRPDTPAAPPPVRRSPEASGRVLGAFHAAGRGQDARPAATEDEDGSGVVDARAADGGEEL